MGGHTSTVTVKCSLLQDLKLARFWFKKGSMGHSEGQIEALHNLRMMGPETPDEAPKVPSLWLREN